MGGAARVGVGGVSNSIRAFPIGWVDVCILTPARQRGAGLNGGLMRVACVLCGACSGHLSVVSRAALRPTRILLFRYYGIDTRAAARCPVKGGGRRRRSAPRPFGHFGLHAQPLCTAPRVMGAPRGGGWGGGGVPKTVKGGAAHIGVGEVARAVTRPKQPHACTAAPVKGEGGDIPGARGREHSARGDRYCSVQCDVQKQLCPAARGKGRPQGSSRQQWVWVSR